MNQRALILLIAATLIFFVVMTLVFQSICNPQQNVVSATVSSYVEKSFAEPQAPMPVDPLSYDGVKKVIVRWVSQYCKR
jgi:c-di-AMP phosphodiesterase-like protein